MRVSIRLAVLVGSFAAIAVLWHGFVADDAMIVARYGTHLVERGELAFNAGERIMAFSSPFQVLLLAGLRVVSGDPLSLYRGLMIVLVPAVLVWAGKRQLPDAEQLTVFLLLTLLSPFVILWTLGGLETPLLVIAVTVFYVLSRDLSPAVRRIAALSVVAGVGFLIRYDSILFFGTALFAIILRKWTVRDGAAALSGGSIAAAWLAFAAVDFHDVVPTSAYVKVNQLFGIGGHRAHMGYTLQFALLSWVWLLGIAPPGQWRHAGSALAAEARRESDALAGLLAFGVYAGWTAASVHMMFGFRLFVPYLPAAVLMAFRFRQSLGDATARRRVDRGLTVTLALAQITLILVIQLRTVNPSFGAYEYGNASQRDYQTQILGAMQRDAAAIQQDWPMRAWSRTRPPRIHTYAAGVLPYALPDAYIFEQLVSYRRRCPSRDLRLPALAPFADYVQILTREGDEAALNRFVHGRELQRIGVDHLNLGGQTWSSEVFFDPSPADNPLPPTIDAPCAPGYEPDRDPPGLSALRDMSAEMSVNRGRSTKDQSLAGRPAPDARP